jgi:hypothetical protein
MASCWAVVISVSFLEIVFVQIRVSYIITLLATTMSTLDGTSNHHNSDSEDDLDYVPEGEGQGVTNTAALF